MLNADSARNAKIVLHPGEYRVSREPVLLSTLLGSCVSVCLYDPVAGVMGMNHFLLAARRGAQDDSVLSSEAGRYGIHAMELLINGLLISGARRSRLRAKAFGGGNVLGTCSGRQNGFECVSTANVRFVREFLQSDGIPLLAADLGGNFGRQIHFTGEDYSVYVRKIHSQQNRALVEEERHYWRDSLQQEKPTQADFW